MAEVRGEDMQRRICAAVVACLDEVGYAETSIGRVQARAEVSRGALTHHFPTKQALMAETATRLLDAATVPLKSRAPQPPDEMLAQSWERIVNRAEGRAFVEILFACRTDADLNAALEAKLFGWDEEVNAAINAAYQGAGAEADDAALLWSITRAFIRGLLIHERFVSDPEHLRRMLRRFGGLLAQEMRLR
ncbi:MAG: helix-turn-helix domain-containing protein [Pseudomonadota bacterium]